MGLGRRCAVFDGCQLDEQVRRLQPDCGGQHGIGIRRTGPAFDGHFNHRIQVTVHGDGVVGGEFAVVAVGFDVGAQRVVRRMQVTLFKGDVAEAHHAEGGGDVFRQRLFPHLQIAGTVGGILDVEEPAPLPVQEPFVQDAGGVFGGPAITVAGRWHSVVAVQGGEQEPGPIDQQVAVFGRRGADRGIDVGQPAGCRRLHQSVQRFDGNVRKLRTPQLPRRREKHRHRLRRQRSVALGIDGRRRDGGAHGRGFGEVIRVCALAAAHC